ncbi:MAG: hypothetical protein KBF35_11370 [Saprospiraceae bacterium]|nr:hypothetical protein [Saprospiraceae bacterium]
MRVTAIFNFIYFMILTVLIPYSCTDHFDPTTGLNGTVNDIEKMLKADDIVQRVSLPVANFEFKTRNNTWINALPNSFIYEDDGKPCTGNINIEITELFTKSEILRYGIPTITLDNKIIESDGEFLFSVSQGNRKVKLAPQKNIILSVKNENPNNQMELFSAIENAWRPVGDEFVPITIVNNANSDFRNIGYGLELNSFKWVNIDYFSKFDKPLVTTKIELPTGYNNNNTKVFAVFADLNIVIPIYGNMYSIMLPADQKVNFVVISAENENEFRFEVKKEMIKNNLTVSMNPKRTSESQIKKALQSLD